MIFLYKILAHIGFILFLFFSPVIVLLSKKRRANFFQRLGLKVSFKPFKKNKKRIWVHALSTGEVKSILGFIKAIKKKYEYIDIVFTASTTAGFICAKKIFCINKEHDKFENIQGQKKDYSLISQLGYFPFDFSFSIKRINQKIKPDSVVIVETDLWPNFLYEMKKQKTPVILINARVFQSSFKKHLFFKYFFVKFFSLFTRIMVQSKSDKKRFKQLGIDENKILNTGNIKFDSPFEEINKDEYIKTFRKCFGIKKQRVFIAGSTHEGEEEILCRVYKRLKIDFPDLLMILAPRDHKRCSDLVSYCLSQNLKSVLMSTGEIHDLKNQAFDIILIDEMGLLSKLYSLCNAAFIGGSMVKEGGHNPLEPALFSKPVLFGKDMSDFIDIAKTLEKKGGAKRVDSEQKLERELRNILKDQKMQADMGKKNFEVFVSNRGASQIIIKEMELLGLV